MEIPKNKAENNFTLPHILKNVIHTHQTYLVATNLKISFSSDYF